MNISPAHFADFFRAIHGYDPFPWQQRLIDQLASSEPNPWPAVLDLPTGAGKTAALDAAVFHLALCADALGKAALRIAFVVDRRLVVDDAYARAEKIARQLHQALNSSTDGETVVKEVAQRLKRLAGENGPPLIAQRLRGGMPLEHDWARTPTQPTIVCSTVDQVGSRLLFRGYGVSDRMKPVHAGLLGNRTLILLDEAHLAEPFRQTLEAVQKIGRADLHVALLSATPGSKAERPFILSPEDRADPTLSRRLRASKPAILRSLSIVSNGKDAPQVAKAFAKEAQSMIDNLAEEGVIPAAVGIVVNRVALARHIFNELNNHATVDVILMTGRSRGIDRDKLAKGLDPFKTEARNRGDAKSLFIVATQCLEVGVDLDLDGLVTQAASLDALRQRFGRLNRAGRLTAAQATIIALKDDISKKSDDPVYGDRIRLTWEALKEISVDDLVDFGVEELPKRLKDADIEMDHLALERPDAPVLMPAYLDLWSHTTPRPTADPDVSLFLHGTERMATGVSIVWRSDISEQDLTNSANLKEIIRLVPPRAAEAVEVSLWAARAWLRQSKCTDMSDAPERQREESDKTAQSQPSRKAFRWAGYDNPDTRLVSADDLRTSDLLIVPSEYGGCDQFGWAPDFESPVKDVADDAAKPYWGRQCAVRITPDISQWEQISSVLAQDASGFELVDNLLSVLQPETEKGSTDDDPPRRNVRALLEKLSDAKAKGPISTPRFSYRRGEGVIIVAERGINCKTEPDAAATPTTEDEAASHTSSRPVPLDEHGSRVAQFAEGFARTLGLHENVAQDLHLAAWLHDAGKADPRFQIMLAGGDPWNQPNGPPLAKSGRPWSPQAWTRAELPKGWRHEALSVRMARLHPDLAKAHDPALVLWLIGTHHGLGRPFFNFLDPTPEKPLACLKMKEWPLPPDLEGPQSLAFDWEGKDWPSLFEHLKQRHGIWGLAHLEAILRLADHRASEQEGKEPYQP